MTTPKITRRGLIAVFGVGAMAWASAVYGQDQNRPARIGILPLGSPTNEYDQSLVEAFRKGLLQVGLVEHRDFVLDVEWIVGDAEEAVAGLLRRGVDMLVPCGTSASLAAKRKAANLPILFISVGNPLGIGLVPSLSHPGSNITGFSDILGDLGGKLLDLATELNRPERTVDYLWHTGWADGPHRLSATEAAADAVGVKLRSRGISRISEIEEAMGAMRSNGARTVIIQPSPFTYGQRDRIIAFARENRIAPIFAFPAAAREGALLAYGPDYVHMYRRAPFYADRILKGTKPGDLPVEQPSKVELVVNLQAAKALGFEVPLSLLIRADELVEQEAGGPLQ